MATLRIAYFYWKIHGLCPYVISNNGEVRLSHGGLIYAIILSVIYTFLYIRAVKDRMTLILPRESPISSIADFSALSFEVCAILAFWLAIGLYHKKIQRIVMSFNNIRESFEALGIPVNNEKLFRNVNFNTIVVNMIWYIVCASILHYSCKTENSTLKFGAIQERFRLLNGKIHDLPKDLSKKMTIRLKDNHEVHIESDELKSLATPSPLEIYGQIHSDLVDLAKSVVECFSLSLLFLTLTQLIHMTWSLYALYLVGKHLILHWRTIGVFIVTFCWTIIHLLEMAIIIFVPDSVAKEANRTRIVLHKILLDRRMEKHINTADMMSLRLLQRPLKMELFSLFQMKLEMIPRIMGMVTTYITIMLQLEDQQISGVSRKL